MIHLTFGAQGEVDERRIWRDCRQFGSKPEITGPSPRKVPVAVLYGLATVSDAAAASPPQPRRELLHYRVRRRGVGLQAFLPNEADSSRLVQTGNPVQPPSPVRQSAQCRDGA